MNLNFIKRYFPYLVIAGLCILLLMQRSCHSPIKPITVPNIGGGKVEIVKYVVDTVYRTVHKVKYLPGDSIFREVPVFIEVPVDVDTANILKDYFSVNVYKDTFNFDDGDISLIDTVSENSIKGRLWDAKIRTKVITETVYLKEPLRRQVYVGGQLGVLTPNSISVGPTVIYKNKREQLYSLSLGCTSQLNMYLTAGMFWKITFRK